MEKVIMKFKPELIVGEDGNYTVVDFKNKGGAIVFDKDPVVALAKFKEATELACALRTFMEMCKRNGKNFYIAEFI